MAIAFLLLFSCCFQFGINARILTAAVHYSGLPKVDEIWYKAYPGAEPEVIVDEFLTGVTDWIDGPSRRDLYEIVVDTGHKVSQLDAMAEFTFFQINCRDYKETSGAPNSPLNDSAFRLAFTYIYGMDDKQTDIFSYYWAPWGYALGNPVPDAQEPWYDESIQMPNTDYDQAWTILQAAGYEVDGDGWLAKGGEKLRDGEAIEVLYATGDLFWPEGPGGGFVRNFNEFLTYIGAVGPTMEILPTDYTVLILELLFYKDFDFICYQLTDLGIYVDWLYDCLHSGNIDTWGWNFAGIVDEDFDEWTETILTSLDVGEIIEAASYVQAKFVYELMPWFPISSGLGFCTTANDERGELMNIVSMPKYGPRNDFSWMTLHWKGSWLGGFYKTALRDEPTTLNPYTEYSSSGWQFLDRTIDGLIKRDPETLNFMPWISMEYALDEWTSIPEIGIEEGSTATFYLRQDVTWHDGTLVTAYDCVSNMRVMREYQPGRYSKVWSNLVYEEADGPYKFNVYFYTPSLYYADYVAETALLVPEHIIDAVEWQVEDGILGDFLDWDPAFNFYEDLTGENPPAEYPFMKQLVGCGPFVFDYYDRSLAIGRVARNEEFFVNAPVLGGVIGEWRIDPDIPYTYRVLVQNLGACEDSEEGELVPATVDVNVYEDEVLVHEETGITLNPWEHTSLGQYTTDSLELGLHTIKVEVYEDGSLIHTYEHKLVATVREDITTYTGSYLDFKVDIKDLSALAKAYGSSPGDPRWDPSADVNDDFRVDILDLNLVGIALGASPEDIAITDVTVFKTVVCQGYSANIEVTVENKGNSPQTVELNINFDDKIVKTRSISLDDGASETVTLFVIPRTFLFEELERISVNNLCSVDVSEDGELIAFLSKARVGIIDRIELSIVERILQGHTEATHWLDATSDLEYIAISVEPCPPGPGSLQSGVELYRFDGVNLQCMWGTQLFSGYAESEVRISEDKKYVAVTNGTALTVLDLSTGGVLWSYDAGAEQFACDGDENLEYIIGATQTAPYKYFVLKNLGNSYQLLTEGSMSGSINDLDSKPDGSYFAFGSDAGEYILINRTSDTTVETVFEGNVGERIESIEIGNSTLLVGSRETVPVGPLTQSLGLIDLYYLNGTLITRLELLGFPEPTIVPVADYDNELYVIGTNKGDIYFLTETGDVGELSLGETAVNDVRIDGSFIVATTEDELVLLKYYSLGFTLPKGNYTLSATAEVVLLEVSIDNNVFTDGWIAVTMVGDINADGRVDILDIARTAKAYDSTPGHPRWFANVDINNDGVVNILDIAIAAKNFGKVNP